MNQESKTTTTHHKLEIYNLNGPDFWLLLHVPAKQISRRVCLVHRYIDNYRLYPPRLDLQIAIIYVLYITTTNGGWWVIVPSARWNLHPPGILTSRTYTAT